MTSSKLALYRYLLLTFFLRVKTSFVIMLWAFSNSLPCSMLYAQRTSTAQPICSALNIS